MFDKTSPEWLSVVKWANDQLATYRQLNDIPGTEIGLTEGYRGRIAVLTELLDLPKADAVTNHGPGAADYKLDTHVER